MTNNFSDKLAIGSVQFGLDYGISNEKGQTPEEHVQEILNVASAYGMYLVDTAQAYGNSESVIGKLHGGRFDIVTKINPNIDESIERLLNESLERLNVNQAYGVLFHNADCATANEKAVLSLERLKKNGLIRKTGYSVYTPLELEELINKYGRPDLVQIPFSHLDQRFLKIASNLAASGTEVHTRSTFLQGLFFLNPDNLSDFFKPVKRYLTDMNQAYPLLPQRAAALLRFVIEKPFVHKVVFGINSVEQLSDNLKNLVISKVPRIERPLVPERILLPYLWE